MRDLNSLMSGAPVPAVAADDLRRVWMLTRGTSPHIGPGSGAVGFEIALIAEQCGEGADPVAVFVRTALLQSLLQTGLLDAWRDGDRPYDVVFDAIAAFPLPHGLQSFRPEDFGEALRKKQ